MMALAGILVNALHSYATHTLIITTYYGGTHGWTRLIIFAVASLYMISHLRQNMLQPHTVFFLCHASVMALSWFQQTTIGSRYCYHP
jgi:hypothetical protein